jgi:hypothetical protein
MVRQYLRADAVDELHVDELHLHLMPVILETGTRFFDGGPLPISVRPIAVTSTPRVTHLTDDVEDSGRARDPGVDKVARAAARRSRSDEAPGDGAAGAPDTGRGR